MLSALYAIARPSVSLSHGWMSQKRDATFTTD